MEEYFPKIDYQTDQLAQIQRVKEMTPNIGSAIIRELGNVGGGYFREKKVMAEMKRQEKIKKEKEIRETGERVLAENKYNISPEGAEQLQKEGWIDKKHIKIIPVSERYRPIQPSRYMAKATKAAMDKLNEVANAYHKFKNPSSDEVFVADPSTTIDDAKDQTKAIETAMIQEGIPLTKAMEKITSPANILKAEQYAREVSGVVGAIKTKPSPKLPAIGLGGKLDITEQKNIESSYADILKISAGKLADSIKRSLPEDKDIVIGVIARMLPGREKDAPAVYERIRLNK